MPSCLRPIRLKNGNIVPCGYCTECKRRLSLTWSFRLQQEVKNATLAVFNTLTYNDVNLPVNSARCSNNGIFYVKPRKGFIYVVNNDQSQVLLVKESDYINARFGHSGDSLTHFPVTDIDKSFPHIHDVPSVRRSDVVLYHKRLRHFFDDMDVSIKYFLCSEYGSNTKRPHYHEILLFYGSDTKKLSFDITLVRNAIMQSWLKGDFLCVDASNSAVINYTIKYIRKAKKNVPFGADNTFRLMSKGIGKKFLLSNEGYLKNLGVDKVTLRFDNGKPSPLPRYYRDYLFTSNPIADRVRINLSKNADYKANYLAWLSRNNFNDSIEKRFEFHEIYYNNYESYLRDTSSKTPSTIKEIL